MSSKIGMILAIALIGPLVGLIGLEMKCNTAAAETALYIFVVDNELLLLINSRFERLNELLQELAKSGGALLAVVEKYCKAAPDVELGANMKDSQSVISPAVPAKRRSSLWL